MKFQCTTIKNNIFIKTNTTSSTHPPPKSTPPLPNSTTDKQMDFLNIPSLPILAKKPKKRTKICATCGVHAPSNKSFFCNSCPGQVRNWVKPVQNKNAGKGKVCPVEGCGWSTKANRKHFCGKCGAAFAAHGKRKAYNKSGLPAKKKQKKTKQSSASTPTPFDDIDFILSSTPPMLVRGSSIELFVSKNESEDENWVNLISGDDLGDDLLVDIDPYFFDNISTDIVEEASSKYTFGPSIYGAYSEYSEICV